MFKNLVEFTYQEGEKVCRFIADNDTDIELAKRAVCDILKKIGMLHDQIKEAQASQSEKIEEIPKVEETKEG